MKNNTHYLHRSWARKMLSDSMRTSSASSSGHTSNGARVYWSEKKNKTAAAPHQHPSERSSLTRMIAFWEAWRERRKNLTGLRASSGDGADLSFSISRKVRQQDRQRETRFAGSDQRAAVADRTATPPRALDTRDRHCRCRQRLQPGWPEIAAGRTRAR